MRSTSIPEVGRTFSMAVAGGISTELELLHRASGPNVSAIKASTEEEQES
jgi:hypothetical protein